MNPSTRPADALPVRQARGQATLDRLLAATEAVMEQAGLEGATIPAIAAHAGVAVGTVYKRFPDKDALLRAVYERFFETSAEQNAAALAPARWQTHSMETIARTLIRGMVAGYRRRRGLLRALFRYAEAHPDPAFRARADALTRSAFDQIGALLLARRAEIAHPEPEAAVRFALLTLGLTLRGLTLHDDALRNPFGGDDERLAGELSRAFLGYLRLT